MKNICVDCFKALGVSSRVKLFEYIENNGRSNVAELTKFIGLKQPTVSYHLKEMADSGLLQKQIRGKEVYYSINSNCPHDGDACLIK